MVLIHVLVTAVLVAALVGVLEWISGRVTRYRVTDHAVEIILLHRFVAKRIPLSEIREIRAIPYWELLWTGRLFCSAGWPTRLLATPVVIQTNRINLLITPRPARHFVAEVNARIARMREEARARSPGRRSTDPKPSR